MADKVDNALEHML
jgi:hypothetical protein